MCAGPLPGAAVATVVHVVGSAYRREGARMLMQEDGSASGAISGGCLELEVQEAAREAARSGRPRLVHFDMTADDDVVWGLGLGCNGRIDVLIEPLLPPVSQCLARIQKARRAGQRLAAAAVVHSPGGQPPVGARLYVYEDEVCGTLGAPELDRAVVADARSLLTAGASRSFLYITGPDGRVRPVRDRQAIVDRRAEGVQVFVEAVVPPPRLVVFGAGHDAIPLVRCAASAGFQVEVVDSRPAYARSERFPGAHRVVCAHPDQLPGDVRFDRDTYAVVMTHNFHQDKEILTRIWGRPYAYLGLLGPWQRTERLLRALEADGLAVAEHLDRLFAPIGLDLGAEGPEQIAVAVVAELLAARNGRSGGFLRFRRGPLHRETLESETPV